MLGPDGLVVAWLATDAKYEERPAEATMLAGKTCFGVHIRLRTIGAGFGRTITGEVSTLLACNSDKSIKKIFFRLL
jgi:hypothetical protein